MPSSNEAVIPGSIQQAVIEAFEIQVGVKIEVLSIGTEPSGSKSLAPSLDCMSVIGLKGRQHLGSIAIGFPVATFLPLLEKMLGEKETAITPQNADACSELLNIIYASARVKINAEGFEFQPAIPTTVHGHDLALALGPTTKILKIIFKSELGQFVVALSLRKT